MKLLAVFGLALAVVVIGKPTFDLLERLIDKPQVCLGLLQTDPSNPVFCLGVLSMVYKGWISLAKSPELISPLARYYLKAGKALSPKTDPPGMGIVHAAILIFMFRVRGDEEMGKDLYNFAMKTYFPKQFKKRLHEKLYTLDALIDFKYLTEEHKQFFMLWTVQKYGKRLECEMGLHQSMWLCYADLAALALVSMGFPLGLLIREVGLLPKYLHPGTTLDSLHDLTLMFLSLTRYGCSWLEGPEKAQLHAFLEKYFKFTLAHLGLLPEKLPDEESDKFRIALELEDQYRCWFLNPSTITGFAGYYCGLVQIGYPAFLLKMVFDFYLSELRSPKGTTRDRKQCFADVLTETLKMVRGGKCPEKNLVCSQLKRTILECKWEAYMLLVELSMEHSREYLWARNELGAHPFVEENWYTFGKMVEREVRAELNHPD